MDTANLTREETAARSAAVTVHRIRVELDLTGAPERARTGFPTVTTLEFSSTVDAIWLDFIGEGVQRVCVNGVDQEIVGRLVPVLGEPRAPHADDRHAVLDAV